MNKKGVNVVISTLLLVAMVVSLVAVYFFWIRGYLSKAQSESSTQQSCSNVEFTAADFCKSVQTVFDITTGESRTDSIQIRFNLRNDVQTQAIAGFLITLDDGKGNTRTISTLPYSDVQGADTKQLATDLIKDTTNINEIGVIPEIDQGGNLVPCSSQEKRISWQGIGSC